MKKITVLITALFIVFSVTFAVMAVDIKGCWSEDTVASFENTFGKDVKADEFFELSEADSYTAKELTEFLASHPEMIADGMTVSESGALVPYDESDDGEEEIEISVPTGGDEVEEKFNPFELIWLGIIVLVIFGAAFFGVFALGKGKKE